MRKKSRWKLLVDLPSCGAKAGMIFEWDREEQAYTTKEMPWYLAPMIPFNYITKKKMFERVSNEA